VRQASAEMWGAGGEASQEGAAYQAKEIETSLPIAERGADVGSARSSAGGRLIKGWMYTRVARSASQEGCANHHQSE